VVWIARDAYFGNAEQKTKNQKSTDRRAKPNSKAAREPQIDLGRAGMCRRSAGDCVLCQLSFGVKMVPPWSELLAYFRRKPRGGYGLLVRISRLPSKLGLGRTFREKGHLPQPDACFGSRNLTPRVLGRAFLSHDGSVSARPGLSSKGSPAPIALTSLIAPKHHQPPGRFRPNDVELTTSKARAYLPITIR